MNVRLLMSLRRYLTLTFLALPLTACQSTPKSATPPPTSNTAPGTTSNSTNVSQASLICPAGKSLLGIARDALQITFREHDENSTATLSTSGPCKGNEGKFLCYQAKSETMINIPPDAPEKSPGDKVVIYINDDADDVTGNGKAIDCTRH